MIHCSSYCFEVASVMCAFEDALKNVFIYQGERGLPGLQGPPGEIGPVGIGIQGSPVSIESNWCGFHVGFYFIF